MTEWDEHDEGTAASEGGFGGAAPDHVRGVAPHGQSEAHRHPPAITTPPAHHPLPCATPHPAPMPNRRRPTRLATALAPTLFSLPLYAAGLGGLNESYAPPPPPKPQVIKDPAAEAEIARLKAKLDKARNPPPKVVTNPTPAPVTPAPTAPVPAKDPAAACWKAGAWQAGCGFAAFAGGPVFRVVGGNLSFTMGSPASDVNRDDDEGPQHPVSFQRRFALAETEVTVAQYLACVDEGGCKEPEWREAGNTYHYQTGSNTYYRESNAHLPDSPITGVNWTNAKQYVAWLSKKGGQTYTLPTEAQWEYAARGGQSGRWYFGDAESQLKDHAWYSANSGGKLHPVGSTRLNTHPWGLKDMAGNAYEWVEDCWHNSYNSAPPNGDKAWESANGGECGQRVVRGGSWRGYAGQTRAANRNRYTSDYRDSIVSFRPSRMLP